jgi:hypothetical protein
MAIAVSAGVALKKLGAWGRGPARPKKIYITGAEITVNTPKKRRR